METSIIVKIVDKALAGGWNPKCYEVSSGLQEEPDVTMYLDGDQEKQKQHRDLLIGCMMHEPYEMVFKHDFAKTFWESEPMLSEEYHTMMRKRAKKRGGVYIPAKTGWQYYLQKMVLESNPLDYLAQFIKE